MDNWYVFCEIKTGRLSKEQLTSADLAALSKHTKTGPNSWETKTHIISGPYSRAEALSVMRRTRSMARKINK